MTKLLTAAIDDRLRHGDLAAAHGKGKPAGALASSAWLAARGLWVAPSEPWELSIALDVVDAPGPAHLRTIGETCFHVAVSSTEWGFYFCHHSRASWIRITDVPFVHERDDFALLARVPPLRELGGLLRGLEARYRVRFRRKMATIRGTVARADGPVRAWLEAL